MKTAKTTNRRNFLLAAGLGGAGAAAAVITAASKTKAVTGAEPATGETSAYRVSEHILKYYKTTEV
jgi:hypothetical protein